MELWDILDKTGAKTGRTMVRGEPQRPGDYYLAVHIWIKNGKGEYLIQRRDDEKPLWPGMWAATGGAAITGETSLQAALREVEEELGIQADAAHMQLLERMKREGWFTDIWMLEQDFPIQSVVMQRGEVSAVAWASPARIREMAALGEFVSYSYLDEIIE